MMMGLGVYVIHPIVLLHSLEVATKSLEKEEKRMAEKKVFKPNF